MRKVKNVARAKIDRDAPFQPISGAAYLTGLSRYYIRRGCKDGSIPHIMAGKDYRINMPVWLEQLDAQSMEGRELNG